MTHRFPRLDTAYHYRTGRYAVRILYEGPAPGPIDYLRGDLPEAMPIEHALRWFRHARRKPDWTRIIGQTGGIEGPSRSRCSGRWTTEAPCQLSQRHPTAADVVGSLEGAEFARLVTSSSLSRHWHRLEIRPEAANAVRLRLRLIAAALAQEFRRQTRCRLPPAPREPRMPRHNAPRIMALDWHGQRFWNNCF